MLFDAPEGDPSSADYVFNPAWLLVASENLPANATLKGFIDSFFKDYYLNASAYRLISNSKNTLAGLQSQRIIMYEYLSGSIKVLRDFAIDPKTNTVYWIKYSAQPGLFSKYLPDAEQMIKSFQLTG